MTENKKVLIVTYYWPPSGGSGVQRWLKFVKYLPQTGWQPYVFTPENPSFAIRDETLIKDVPPETEVYHFPIWEPYEAFFRITRIFGQRSEAKPTDLVSLKNKSPFQRLSMWMRANLLIPDPRVFWVKPSVRFLSEFLKDNRIDTLVTTGPPHSLHLIGLALKKKNRNLRWIADFRDPWSEWGFLDSLNVGSLARQRHRRLEADVLRSADEVLTITPFYARQFSKLGNRNVHLLTNGFDEKDFENLVYKKADKFLIRHVGIVNEKCDPRPFMRVLAETMQRDKQFASKIQLDFFGEVHNQIKMFVSNDPLLKRVTAFHGNIPHDQLMQRYGDSSLLLLVLTGYKDAEGYMPGKLFEYIATGLPVLGIGPASGDAASLIHESGIGKMFDTDDARGIQDYLLQQFSNWDKNDSPQRNLRAVQKYSRRAITEQLAKILSR